MDPHAEELIAGRYRLIEPVGSGAAGIVYRAWDTKLEEEIALKVLQQGATIDANEIARFKREITLARKITHPNVIRIHDFGESGKHVFISMELLVGGTMADRLIAGVPLTEALSIAIGVCEGVQAAHVLGIVHRDLKPENILFDAYRRPKVADFGLARLTTLASRSVGFSGTPFYMSPEHANGLEITTRSDVYSLGVLLFQLFTGKLPFQADNFARLVTLHCHELPPSPRSVQPGIPPELEKVILRALEKDPRARHATAGDLAAELQRVSQASTKDVAAVENLSMEDLEKIVADPASSRSQAVAALERIARKHLETGNIVEHANTLERLAGRMPSGGAEKLTLAGELLSGIDPNRAIRCWERAVSEDPQSIRALEHLAAVREERQEWQQLITVLNGLIAAYRDLQPKAAADAFCKKGLVLQKQLGIPEKARQSFRLALTSDPDHVPSLKALLALSDEEGDQDTANELVDHLAELGVPEAAERLRSRRAAKPKAVEAGGLPPMPTESLSHRSDDAAASPAKSRVAPKPPKPPEPRRSMPVVPVAGGVLVLGAIVTYLVYTSVTTQTIDATPTPTPFAVATTVESIATPEPTATEALPTPPEVTATPEPTQTRIAVVPTRTPRATATPTPVRTATPAPTVALPVPTPTPLQTVAALRTPPPATPTPPPEGDDPRMKPFHKGNELLKANKITEAVRELKKAVKNDESYPDGHFFLAAAYAAQGEDRYACAELGRYIQLAPNGRYAARARTSLANCE